MRWRGPPSRGSHTETALSKAWSSSRRYGLAMSKDGRLSERTQSTTGKNDMWLATYSKISVLYEGSCPRLQMHCGESQCNAAGDANTAPNRRGKRPNHLGPGERPAPGSHRAGLHPRAKPPRSHRAEPVPRVTPASPAVSARREEGRDTVAQPPSDMRPPRQ